MNGSWPDRTRSSIAYAQRTRHSTPHNTRMGEWMLLLSPENRSLRSLLLFQLAYRRCTAQAYTENRRHDGRSLSLAIEYMNELNRIVHRNSELD